MESAGAFEFIYTKVIVDLEKSILGEGLLEWVEENK